MWKVFLKKRSKINYTKLYTAYMDSPPQEISNGGLGIVVTFMIFSGTFFMCFYWGSNPAVGSHASSDRAL